MIQTRSFTFINCQSKWEEYKQRMAQNSYDAENCKHCPKTPVGFPFFVASTLCAGPDVDTYEHTMVYETDLTMMLQIVKENNVILDVGGNIVGEGWWIAKPKKQNINGWEPVFNEISEGKIMVLYGPNDEYPVSASEYEFHSKIVMPEA